MKKIYLVLATRSILMTFFFSFTVLLCSGAIPRMAWAHSSGMSGYSGNPATSSGAICTACHSASGTAPTVALTGPTSLPTGSSGVYTFTITGGAAVDGGLDVSATSGTLSATDPNTQLMSGEVTHKSAISFTSGSLSFMFTLVAPSSAGSLTLYAAGLSANGSGSSGDNAAKKSLAVNVTAPSAPQIVITDSVVPTTDDQIPFGTITDGNTSDKTVTVSNSGNANLVVGTIASANPLAAPFSIQTDNCSGQTIAPAGTCTLTVRFAPVAAGAFDDSFDIPSNDPSTPSATVSVSGTGNNPQNNPPTAPSLVSPADGETGVGTTTTLEWKRSTDPDGDPITYNLYYCTDSTFVTCTPVVATSGMTGIYFAGSGLLFLGFVMTRGGRGRKFMLVLMMAMLLTTGVLIVSCGSGSSSTPVANTNMTYQVSGLNNATKYYWKVIADDGKGGLASSATWSFSTQ